jgi:Ala-tRNA(Pro) deacylase
MELSLPHGLPERSWVVHGIKKHSREAKMPARQLSEFLDSNDVKYVTIRHSPAYTAHEVAASAHIPGKDMAKTVIVDLDGKMAMAVVPASSRLDLDQLKAVASARQVAIADERKFERLFPDCEVGAMPPFGNLYGLDVFVADSLAEDEEIAFNAGSHTEVVRLAYQDFERLVHPKVAKLT